MLDLISEPIRKATEISFQDFAFTEKEKKISKIELLTEADVSDALTKMVLAMLHED